MIGSIILNYVVILQRSDLILKQNKILLGSENIVSRWPNLIFLLVLISQKKFPTSKVNVNLKLIRKARIKVAVHINANIVELL